MRLIAPFVQAFRQGASSQCLQLDGHTALLKFCKKQSWSYGNRYGSHCFSKVIALTVMNGEAGKLTGLATCAFCTVAHHKGSDFFFHFYVLLIPVGAFPDMRFLPLLLSYAPWRLQAHPLSQESELL